MSSTAIATETHVEFFTTTARPAPDRNQGDRGNRGNQGSRESRGSQGGGEDYRLFPIVEDPSAFPMKTDPLAEALPPLSRPPKVMNPRYPEIRILRVRNTLVMLDSDIASLYATTNNIVNKTAMRNACRFPRSHCFRLTYEEWYCLQDIVGGTPADRGDWLCLPLVFTEDGLLALATVINTFEAIRGCVLAGRELEKLGMVVVRRER